ncbi:hypothetical protein GCM10007425_07830 [Lysinibacillus alkalisoli]|uniref:DUF4352 domain-containing protein n=1 Tax=Lysinibacillus alkalisoli TaxID=1911548 RepID=A0A917G072_9BACI|nr:DUF4352 domain-containing protein [Lysinibacillus alkalisoli]GGG15960.1 hypothetical protein GCM10007425_07830 [Lysinibacillus alkalisoli]
MKKILLSGSILLFLLGGCGSNNDESQKKSEVSTEKNEKSAGKITEDDITKLYTSPKKFKGYEYEFVGKLLGEPEQDDEGTYLQIYADPQNYEKNTIVAIKDPTLKIKEDDYVRVKGTIEDTFEGENMLGGKVTAPMVLASSVKVIDYAEALAPTLKEIKVEKEINQNDFIVKVEKIEFAKPHTRVFFTIDNKTNDKISFYTFNTKLIHQGKQLEEDTDYDANYPELQSELLPGVSSTGIITYPAINIDDLNDLKIYAEGSSNNYDIEMEPFVFEIENTN